MTPSTIKEITREELYEYFRFVHGEARTPAWPQSQGDLIGEVFCDLELVTSMILRMKAGAPANFTTLDSYLTMAVFGFQCGREFEYRQNIKAMRSEVADEPA